MFGLCHMYTVLVLALFIGIHFIRRQERLYELIYSTVLESLVANLGFKPSCGH
jgi:hypothetical protein